MLPAVFHIAAATAGLAILSAGLIVFPNDGLKGLAKGLALTISLAVGAALLIATARIFGP